MSGVTATIAADPGEGDPPLLCVLCLDRTGKDSNGRVMAGMYGPFWVCDACWLRTGLTAPTDPPEVPRGSG